MENNLSINSPRQERAILALLEKSVAVKDLGPIIGALNPRQVIFELRQQGFKGIILTRRFTVIDQDGKRCRPGEYYISIEARAIVEKALLVQTRPGALKKPKGSIPLMITGGESKCKQ